MPRYSEKVDFNQTQAINIGEDFSNNFNPSL